MVFGNFLGVYMFENLTNFKSVRSLSNAIGFYLAYLFIGILLGAIAGGVAGFFSNINGSMIAGNIIAIPYVIAIGLIVTNSKNLGFSYYALSIASGILALFGGALLGLIPSAIISTMQIIKKE